jgi:hypothetical protein
MAAHLEHDELSHIRLNLFETASMAEEWSYSFSEEGNLEQIVER